MGVGRAILPELEHKEDVFKTSFKTSSAFTMREKETPTHIYIIRIIEYNFGCDNCNTCVLSRPSGSKRGWAYNVFETTKHGEIELLA